ncbi:unnamed protein product [Ilex paraguariensis]|uniref:Uncharacterized protein n=1 Tax=Ilex paraguariensis TaxID=185542 RepID=A0ABC8UT44_9AQUA
MENNTYRGFTLVIEDVLYDNGTFYCVFPGGVLGAYSLASQELKLLTDMMPILNVTFRSEIRVVESDGTFCWYILLWALIFSGLIVTDDLGRARCLQNKALLLCCTSYSISAEKNTSALVDNFYIIVTRTLSSTLSRPVNLTNVLNSIIG